MSRVYNNHESYFSTHKWLIIILLIVAVFALGSNNKEDYVDDSFTPTGEINNIKVGTGYADVKVVVGDTFRVEGKNLVKDDYEFKQEGDTLNISVGKNNSYFNFSFFNFQLWGEDTLVTITIPEKIIDKMKVDTGSGSFTANTDLNVKDSSIKLGSGDVDIKTIKGDTLTVDIGSGDLEFKNIYVDSIDVNMGSGDADCGYMETQDAKISVGSGGFNCKSLEAMNCKIDLGSGDISANNINVQTMSGSVGSGEIDLKGKLTGKTDFKCGSGDIDLNLDGEVDDYYLDLKGDDISINNKKYGDRYTSGTLLDKQLILGCSSGSIEITIR